MAVNALSKLAADMADIPIKNMDGSPMLQDDGSPVTATVFGPATKVWQVAHAARRRKSMRRVRENNGKIEAVADDGDDVIEFLCAVTRSFNGIMLPDLPPVEQVRAIYSHPGLGYIRDHMDADTSNWENFTRASQTNSPSMLVSTPG